MSITYTNVHVCIWLWRDELFTKCTIAVFSALYFVMAFSPNKGVTNYTSVWHVLNLYHGYLTPLQVWQPFWVIWFQNKGPGLESHMRCPFINCPFQCLTAWSLDWKLGHKGTPGQILSTLKGKELSGDVHNWQLEFRYISMYIWRLMVNNSIVLNMQLDSIEKID